MSRVKPFSANPANNRVSRARKAITLLMCCSFIAANASSYNNNPEAKHTNSKRIEVYSLAQNYWDVQYGDTLGGIVQHLLPHNLSKRKALQQDVLLLNPGAFIDGKPAKLQAGKRLWLPGYMKQADTKANSASVTVETYSWGNIKRPRKQFSTDEHR